MNEYRVAFLVDNLRSALHGQRSSLIVAGFCVIVVVYAIQQYRL